MGDKSTPIFLKTADCVIKVIFNHNPWSPLVGYWYELLHDKCGKWIINNSERYDATLQFSQQGLFVWDDKLKKRYYTKLYEQKIGRVFETYYHISFYQFTAILRVILQSLLQSRNGLLLHCSANKIASQSAYIFIGKSGAGKSTISSLLQSRYPKVADDTVAIVKENNIFYLYPLPLDNPSFVAHELKESYRIEKFFILDKSRHCKVKNIQDKTRIFSFLISSLWAEDIKESNKVLFKIKDLIDSNNRFYILEFTKDKKELIRFFRNLINNST